jgi:hypothetical protein
MGFPALLGRSLFALIFLSSALNKARTFGDDGGPTALFMAPKLDSFKVSACVTGGLHRGRARHAPCRWRMLCAWRSSA